MAKVSIDSLCEKELLKIPLCDLNLSLKSSRIFPCLQKLYLELKQKGLRFRPKVWISNDWFTPDGSAGFAIPFFLLHSKLIKLERKYILEAEGATNDWCLKLLRHETAHALDNAFYLRKLKKRQNLFGLSGKAYPQYYIPRPYSRNFVVNLDHQYGQAHPDEDWAETFAVWLGPRSGWRKKYRDWPALKKISYLDEVMASLAGKPPLNTQVFKDLEIGQLEMTVEEYLEKKREHFGLNQKPFFERKLTSLFVEDRKKTKAKNVALLFQKNKKTLSKNLSTLTQQHQYIIEKLLDEIVEFCQERDLRMIESEEETLGRIMPIMQSQVNRYVSLGKHRIIM